MDLAEILPGLECPMNWNMESGLAAMSTKPSDSLEQERERVIKSLYQKLQCDLEYELTDASAAVQKCGQYLMMAWLHYRPSESSQNLLKKYLEEADKFLEYAGTKINLITRYTKALNYLFNAMWVYLYHEEKNLNKLQEYLDFFTPFGDLEDGDRAAVFALKSCVFMETGPCGQVTALEAIGRALELENEAEWHFLKGKCMSRYRRAKNFQSVPSDEELFHLRKAVEMKQGSASHYVFCGQSVKEFAMYSPTTRNTSSLKDALMDECEEYFVCVNNFRFVKYLDLKIFN